MPENADGVIDSKVIKEEKRAKLEGETIKVLVASEVKDAKGFKFRDTFKHKGVETNPWSGAWNVVMVLGYRPGARIDGRRVYRYHGIEAGEGTSLRK